MAPLLPGVTGDFQARVYTTPVERTEYLALILGDVSGDQPVLVRVQTTCFAGDVFNSAACDCGAQLRAALGQIEREGQGVLLYVHASGRQSLLGDFRSHVLHEGVPRVEGVMPRRSWHGARLPHIRLYSDL